MKPVFSRLWPASLAIALYGGIILVLLHLSLARNQGHFVYLLDDAYIHMAMARNVALHGVWGVTPDGFSSSSSAPLWTALLALVNAILGVGIAVPLILNVLAGVLALLAAFVFLRRYPVSGTAAFMILALAIAATPLPTLTFEGLEHPLHILLAVCFLFLADRSLSAAPGTARRADLALCVLAPLLTTVRYEGIFMAFVVCVLLLLRRRVAMAFVLGGLALASVVAFGAWSLSKGWFFLPNPVWLNGYIPRTSAWEVIKSLLLYRAWRTLCFNPHLFVPLLCSLAILLAQACRNGRPASAGWLHWIYVLTALLHLQFASTGHVFRYEAYLVFLGIVTIGAGLGEPVRAFLERTAGPRGAMARRLAALLLAVACVPLAQRAQETLRQTLPGISNIYEQQYQVGRLLGRHDDGWTVALNDLGAMTYYGNVKVLDLWGLGSREVARLRRENRLTTGEIDRLAGEAGVDVAILYEPWYQDYGGLPASWENVGQWRIENNLVCGYPEVSFLAVKPAARARLIERLRLFSGQLPATVRQSGLYLKP